jgi:hypothetical protein
MAVQTPAFPNRYIAAGFDWDDGNRRKCQQHGVSTQDIEAMFGRPIAVYPDPAHSADEERLKAIGRTDKGRSVLVVFTLRRRGVSVFVRPISARFMHAREVEYYEKEAAKAGQR